MAAENADVDPAFDFDDFATDHGLCVDKVWPCIAAQIAAFEPVKVTRQRAGQCVYKCLDQNAITAPHPEVGRFLFLNGFSCHGMPQSPAMGRAAAERTVHGA
jgi:glycine/D-amino acid oxidase-like deaminating enzyme